MGFLVPSDTMNNLESIENLDEKLKIYDWFVERQMMSTQSDETHKFLLPIWKLRSNFNDALRPVEENMIQSILSKNKVQLATAAIKEGRLHDGSVAFMLQETRECYHTYQEYMRRLKQLYNRTKYIFKTISHHKVNILDEYAEVHHFDPVAVRHHYNRIVYVLEMSIVIADSIQDAIQNAQSVVECASENLDIITNCYDTISLLEQLEAQNESVGRDPLQLTTLAMSRCNGGNITKSKSSHAVERGSKHRSSPTSGRRKSISRRRCNMPHRTMPDKLSTATASHIEYLRGSVHPVETTDINAEANKFKPTGNKYEPAPTHHNDCNVISRRIGNLNQHRIECGSTSNRCCAPVLVTYSTDSQSDKTDSNEYQEADNPVCIFYAN